MDTNEELCWQAVLNREARGDFVYAVLSTRIFCRPSCPSRRPRREQVLFFARPTEAREAGFRACKRCRPEEDTSSASRQVEQACRIIEARNGEPLSLGELSLQVGISSHHLQRVFKKSTGVTPRAYADSLRMKSLRDSLGDGETVSSALYGAGFGSSRALYERAPSRLGMTPSSYRGGGQNMQIHYAIVPCELGFLLVAATEKGLCSVALGDSPEELESQLKREFPRAQVLAGHAQLQESVQHVLSRVEGHAPHQELPLDIRATAFQQRVWEALRSIPRGETRTYSQVAQEIEQPSAVRAVARACATNPLALVVPCHRVVRGDGSPSGYRWGLERKHLLLAKERSEADV
jgi:AraC family transcriptional regulator of adaptative response/methylated-DNA-[protein]-cysteine methyltransferase